MNQMLLWCYTGDEVCLSRLTHVFLMHKSEIKNHVSKLGRALIHKELNRQEIMRVISNQKLYFSILRMTSEFSNLDPIFPCSYRDNWRQKV